LLVGTPPTSSTTTEVLVRTTSTTSTGTSCTSTSTSTGTGTSCTGASEQSQSWDFWSKRNHVFFLFFVNPNHRFFLGKKSESEICEFRFMAKLMTGRKSGNAESISTLTTAYSDALPIPLTAGISN
jgi:hypothetical protein